MIALSKLYEELELGYFVVPDIQRDFVWRNPQVLDLAFSIYKKLPIGAVYVCDMPQDMIEEYDYLFKPITDEFELRRGKYIIIDGRQRLTSLLLIKYGRVKTDNRDRRLELYFNPWEERFQLAKGRSRPEGCWFKVSEVLQAEDVEDVIDSANCGNADKKAVKKSLNKLRNVFSTYQVPIVNIEVEWDRDDLIKVFDRWSEMFVRLNSRGTKVKLPDLVLALVTGKTIAGRADSFRKRFHDLIEELEEKGYDVDSPPLIRAYLAISTGKVKFREASPLLSEVSPQEHLKYLDATRDSVVRVLGIMKDIGVRLCFLQSTYLPVIPSVTVYYRYLAPKRTIDDRFKRDLMRWLLYASFDRRYSGRLESDLYEDISTLTQHSYDIGSLLKNLRTKELSEEDLSGEYDDRHLTLLSILYTHNMAKDWDTKSIDPAKVADIPDDQISIHHIFPEAVLRKSGYDEELRNDVANITLISKTANKALKDEEPSTYLRDLYRADPALLELHFVPTEEALWRVDNYKEFLRHRRRIILEGYRKIFTPNGY
jgi:hypothetical protein